MLFQHRGRQSKVIDVKEITEGQPVPVAGDQNFTTRTSRGRRRTAGGDCSGYTCVIVSLILVALINFSLFYNGFPSSVLKFIVSRPKSGERVAPLNIPRQFLLRDIDFTSVLGDVKKEYFEKPAALSSREDSTTAGIEHTQHTAVKYKPVKGLTKSKVLNEVEVQQINELIGSDSFRALLPLADEFFERKSKWRSCAVVGNSGILLNDSRGAEIDSHDMVMRFNWPPLGGYEEDVGTRTTFMVVNRKNFMKSQWPPYVSFTAYERDVTVLLNAHFLEEFYHFAHWASESHRRDAHKIRLIRADFRTAVTKSLQRNFGTKATQASTGMLGVVASLAACGHVDVYGFGPSKFSGNGHYYAPSPNVLLREWRIHDFSAEQQFFRLLERGEYPHFLKSFAKHAKLTFHRDDESKVLIDELNAAIPDPKLARLEFDARRN